MKTKKNPKPTPEETLRRACEEDMGSELTYNQIRDRLDTAEIARVGQVRQASAKTDQTAAPTPSPRRAVPAVLLVLAVLILTPALAVGSFLIARSTMDPAPPVAETVHSSEDQTPPAQGLLPNSPPENTLPVETIPTPIETIFDLNGSYATENALFLRLEHLSAESLGEAPLSTLEITDHDTWKGLFPELSAVTYEDYSALYVSLRDYDQSFFSDHSLLILFTEGRSGSIRYRVDDLTVNHQYIKATLTAGIPNAVTMDVVYWCVIIPVEKPQKGETAHLVYVETQDIAMNSFEDFVTLMPEIYRGLWFWGYSDGSYAQGSILYGRIGQVREMWSWTYPRTETVNTLSEWQALYGGNAASSSDMDTDFLAGLDLLDEAFFDERSLLVLYLEEGSGSIRHRVDAVTVEDGTLTVTVTALYPEVGTDDMAYWAILIPVAKEVADLPVAVEYNSEAAE